jgi:hypothetical protein
MPEANSPHTPIRNFVLPDAPPAVNIVMVPAEAPKRMVANHDLAQLCAQHIAHRQALLACPQDPEDSPHWALYTATSDAIAMVRPATLAELAAKARAAKHEARVANGREDIRSGSAVEWVWDLVNDLVRLGEAAA